MMKARLFRAPTNDLLLDLAPPTSSPTCSVLVATYNRASLLELVLCGFAIQTRRDFEVIICDDGSTPDTLEVLKRVAPRCTFGLRYLWQEDRSFRKTRVLNRGILAARTDYLLFTDDDCVPHRKFVEGHLNRKRQDTLIFGTIVRVYPTLTAAIMPEIVLRGGLESSPYFTPGKRLELLRSWAMFYKHLLLKNQRKPKLYGADFGVEKAWMHRVNGFDEGFIGWGYEDKELRMRLVNAGIRMSEAILAAVVFHLDERVPRHDQYKTGLANKKLFLQRVGASWANEGLSGHAPAQDCYLSLTEHAEK